MTSSKATAYATADDLDLTMQVWKEGPTYVAYAPELDLSSCGRTVNQAKAHLREAVTLFLEEAAKRGTLADILAECGFERRGRNLRPPRIIEREKLRIALPAA